MESTTAIPSIQRAPLDHQPGRRINVRGGGGKTTLSRAIARKHGLRFIELDATFWLPNWVESEIADFRRKVQQASDEASEGWVIDGNYSGYLGDLVLKRADMIVWLNLPWRVMFWRVLKRSFRRARDKQRICGENVESWRTTLSTDSLWWWYISNRRRLIRRGERFLPLVPEGVPVIEIRTADELDRFYELQGLTK